MRPLYKLTAMSEAEIERHRCDDDEACLGSLDSQLPLRTFSLRGKISDLVFSLRLRQTFQNCRSKPLQAIYIFPLPPRSAVTHFVLRLPHTEVVGELKEREDARDTYDRAIGQGFQAAVAEQDRSDVFTLSVGNIPPGQNVQIELEIVGPLEFADGMATFRFPLVLAPRYMSGWELPRPNVGAGWANDTDRTPDASRISPPLLLPGTANPVELDLEIELDMGSLEISAIYSSLKDLILSERQDRVSLAPSSGQLNQDLILRFAVGAGPQASLRQVADLEGPEYTFALTLVAAQPPQGQPVARNLVVLLDTSGSMAGWKMAAACRAVGLLIDTLGEHDRFLVLLFDSWTERLSPSRELERATHRNRARVVQRLSEVKAEGGTELNQAILEGLNYLTPYRGEGDCHLVLVTDGQVGNEDELLKEVEQHAAGVRLHTVGIDRAVNAGLLQRLAQFSGGQCELAESLERVEEAMRGLRLRLGRPLVTELEMDCACSQVVPSPVELFAGFPARLYGRSNGPLPDRVGVSGRLPDGRIWRQELTVQSSQDPSLRLMWAREKVMELEYELFTAQCDDSCTPATIASFSQKHGVLSRFSAFVAVERSRPVEGGGESVVQAVDLPLGWCPPPLNQRPTLYGSDPTAAQPAEAEEVVDEVVPVIEVQLAFSLWELVDDDGFLSRKIAIRDDLATFSSKTPPWIRLVRNLRLAGSAYCIQLAGWGEEAGALHPGHFWGVAPEEKLATLGGLAAPHALWGLPSRWFPVDRLDELTKAGCMLFNGAEVLALHIHDVLCRAFLNQPTRWRQQYTKPALLRALIELQELRVRQSLGGERSSRRNQVLLDALLELEQKLAN